MKYSFVLPAYKAAFLRESIDSILNQTYKDFELIIVNDASPEDLTSIVNSYQDERIQYYVNEKNVGGTDLVAQWNHCITYAIGEYLILASDDDVYHPDYLEKMDVLVDKYPKVNIFRPRVQFINSVGDVSGKTNLLDEFISQVDFIFLRHQGEVLSGIPFYIFKRSELITNGGFINFPTAWFSDDATVIRLSNNGTVTHSEVLFSFRYSGINISSKPNNTEMLYKKVSATEAFYLWLAKELESMNITEENEMRKRDLIRGSLDAEKRNHMVLLICASQRKTVLSCWSLLRKVKTLGIAERRDICKEVFKRKILKKY